MFRTEELEKENAQLRADNRKLQNGPTKQQVPGSYADAGTACYEKTQGQVGRGPTPEEVIDILFTFHDDAGNIPHFVEVREAAKAFAKVIVRHVPACGDRLTAVTKVREAVMFANAGIALDGRGL